MGQTFSNEAFDAIGMNKDDLVMSDKAESIFSAGEPFDPHGPLGLASIKKIHIALADGSARLFPEQRGDRLSGSRPPTRTHTNLVAELCLPPQARTSPAASDYGGGASSSGAGRGGGVSSSGAGRVSEVLSGLPLHGRPPLYQPRDKSTSDLTKESLEASHSLLLAAYQRYIRIFFRTYSTCGSLIDVCYVVISSGLRIRGCSLAQAGGWARYWEQRALPSGPVLRHPLGSPPTRPSRRLRQSGPPPLFRLLPQRQASGRHPRTQLCHS